jgi:hypothetical protein
VTDWPDLTAELDAWHAEGRAATLWWRDDDATRPTAALDQLLDTSRATRTPLALAVIPGDLEAGLADRLAAHPQVCVLQHGWRHTNHAPPDERQDEYGPHRPLTERLAELAEGWRRLVDLPRPLPVLVAPWNRMDPALLPRLPEIGIAGVSTLGAREAAEAAPGLRRTNVHVDIVDWHGSGGFVGDASALGQIVDHLRQRRDRRVDPDEPTGLMTHHLFHDPGCWAFIARLLAATRPHPAARWLTAPEAFWP